MQSVKWNDRFLRLAAEVATWSKDPRRKVGAVIVRPDRTIAALGYNGFPRGVHDTQDRLIDREAKNRFVVHAELNSILSAREPLQGYTLYVTPYAPCASCAGAIIQAGIKTVITDFPGVKGVSPDWLASFDTSRKMFVEAGVELIELKLDKLNTVA